MDERQTQPLLGLTLDAEEGPARRLSTAALDAQVAAIMGQVMPHLPQETATGAALAGTRSSQAAAPFSPPGSVVPVRRSWALSKVRVAIVVGVGLLAGSAAAMVARQVVRFTRGELTIETAAPPRVARPVMTRQPSAAKATEQPVAEVAAEEVDVPDAPAPQRRKPTSTPDLMAKANRLRGAGRFRAAERTYLAVVHADPTSAAAHVAAVAAAAIRLEHLDDLAGAAGLYRRALKIQPSGPLVAECYEGLSRIHREHGDVAAEVRALRALLTFGQPGPARARAAARLRTLEQQGAPPVDDKSAVESAAERLGGQVGSESATTSP